MGLPSPNCTVNGSTPPQNVSATSSVAIALVNPAGAVQWFLGITACDDTSTLSTLQASLAVNQTAHTATCTAAGVGSCFQVMSTVSANPNKGSLGFGYDVNGALQPAYTTTFKVNVLATNGLAVIFPGELAEQDPVNSGGVLELNAIIRTGGGGGGGAGNLFGLLASRPAASTVAANTVYFATDTGTIAASDGTSWHVIPAGGGQSLADQGTIYAPPLAATWTHINFGSGTTVTDSGLAVFPTVFLSDTTSGGNENAHAVVQTITGGSGTHYTLTAALRPLPVQANNSSVGLVVTDGTKMSYFAIVYVTGAQHIQVVKLTNPTTFSANSLDVAVGLGLNGRDWFQIQDDGTHRSYRQSNDGVNFYTFYQEASGTFLNETEFGIVVNPLDSGGGAITLESWHPTYP